MKGASVASAPARVDKQTFREPGSVLLISCYELGRQPLNLAFPLAVLREHGYGAVAVDTAIDPLPDAVIERARFVAISVPMHTALRLGTQIATRVRQLNPEAEICFYGLYAWLNADYLLREFADTVIGGEFEAPLLRLLEARESDDDGSIDGVSDRQHHAAPSLERIAFPEPARETLPQVGQYAWLIWNDEQVPAGYTEATRGCHHMCKHCPVVPIYQGRFFAIPRKIVIDDIRRQISDGARHFSFGDPDALNGPTHLLRIMRAIHEERPEITFDITTRIEHILEHREIIPELAANGLIFIISAVEILSDRVLQKIDKGHTKADVIEALQIARDAGVAMRPSLLPFTPWTTMEDYLELVDFVAEQEIIECVDPVHLSIRLLVPPGSSLLDEPDTGEWVGELDEAGFTYRWTHDDPRMDDLQQRVATTAETAEREQWDAYETYNAIRMLTYQAAGKTPPPPVGREGSRPAPPRLTESWFC